MHMHTCIHAHAYMHMHICTLPSGELLAGVCTPYAHAYMHMHMHMYACICTCIHAHAYACTHMHMHMHMPPPLAGMHIKDGAHEPSLYGTAFYLASATPVSK